MHQRQYGHWMGITGVGGPPSHWNSGSFQGQQGSKPEFIEAGETQITDIDFTNTGQSEISLVLTRPSPHFHEVRI